MNPSLALKAIATQFVIMTVCLSPASADKAYDFRVMFEHIPGTESLDVSQVSQSIPVLERMLQQGTSYEGRTLATLCGAYVLSRDLGKAEKTCAAAVERFPSETAYNNRGVLRALRGDLAGARRDFDRARPESMAAYIELLKTREIGFIATDNHELLQQLLADRRDERSASSFASIKGAEVEIIE